MNGLDFVKGHCGWDAVTLLLDDQIAPADALATAVKIISPPVDGGLEAGLLSRGARRGEIRVRMVNSTTRDWIPMCGGMTQVIGKALVETFMGTHFDIDVSAPRLSVTLITEAGEIPVEIEIERGRATRITTVMDHYLSALYATGIERLQIDGVPVLRIGKYAILQVHDLEGNHPDVDFTRRNPGRHLDIVNRILRSFRDRMGWSGANGMLYDTRPEGPGAFRVFPRFFSEDLAAARIPFEFQCGTGTIAVAAALAYENMLAGGDQMQQLVFEWGSQRTTPDPFGIRTSQVSVELDGERLRKAAFSHSVVEIVASGQLYPPSYEALSA